MGRTANDGTTESFSSTRNVFNKGSLHRRVSVEDKTLYNIPGTNDELELIRPETHPEAFVPVAPDKGWSWMVLIACLLSNMIIDGITSSIGIFLMELSRVFNTPKAKTALLGALFIGFYQIVGPVVAALINRYGCRSVAFGGTLFAVSTFIISSFMPNMDALLITFGILAGSSFGFIHLPSIISVNCYFNRRRALANGIAVTGTPIGAVIFGQATTYLLKAYHWSNTLVIYAGLILHGLIFACIYRPLKPSQNLEPFEPADIYSAINSRDLIGPDIYSSLIASNGFIHSSSGLAGSSIRVPPTDTRSFSGVESTRVSPKKSNLHDVNIGQLDANIRAGDEEANGDKAAPRSEPIDRTSQPSRLIPSVLECLHENGRGTEIGNTELQTNRKTSEYKLYTSKDKPSDQTSIEQRNIAMAKEKLFQPSYRPRNFVSQIFTQDFNSALTLSALTKPNWRDTSCRRSRGGPNLIHSAHFQSSIISGLVSPKQKLEFAKLDSKPVLVLLPHNEIHVEDYRRPMYRNDIFYSGNVAPDLSGGKQDVESTLHQPLPGNEFISSRRTLHSGVGSQYALQHPFSSGMLFNHQSVNVAQNHPNWYGSYLVSLTSIPIPKGKIDAELLSTDSDLYRSDRCSCFGRKRYEITEDLESLHELSLNDCCLTCLRRLRDRRIKWSRQWPRPKSFVNKAQVNIALTDDMNDEEHTSFRSQDTRFYRCFATTCSLKPVFDVLSTMTDVRLLRNFKFMLVTMANFFCVLGLYVPTIYVSEFAEECGISSDLSSHLISVMGLTNIIARPVSAYFGGPRYFNPLMIQTVAQIILGILIALMPFLTSFTMQMIVFALYGVFSAPFASLSTIVLCDVVGIELLTSAVGIVSLSRGLSSTLGAPLAGVLFSVTGNYTFPYIAAGVMVVVSGLQLLAVICFF